MAKAWHNTLSLDFDGCLYDYAQSFEAGIDKYDVPPVYRALKGILRLVAGGWYIEIFSGRSATLEGRQWMESWLRDKARRTGKLDIVEAIRAGKITFASDKPVAKVYLDDRGMRFDGDWEKITPEALDSYRAWWQAPGSVQ